MDATGNHVSGQHIGEHIGLGTKLYNHMIASIQGIQNLFYIVVGTGVANIFQLSQASEFALQRHNGRLATHFDFTKFLNLFVTHGE